MAAGSRWGASTALGGEQRRPRGREGGGVGGVSGRREADGSGGEGGCNDDDGDRRLRSVPRGTGLRMVERPAQERESEHRGSCVCFRRSGSVVRKIVGRLKHGSSPWTGPPSQLQAEAGVWVW